MYTSASLELPDTNIATLRMYLRTRRLGVLLLFGFLVADTGLRLLAPLIVRQFIDTVVATRDAPVIMHLWMLAGLFIAVTLGNQAIGIATTYVSERVGWAVTNSMRNDLVRHCLGLDLAFHNQRTPGDLVESIDGDVSALAGFFSQFAVEIVGGCILLSGILLTLFAVDYRVGIAFSVFAVIGFLLLRSLRHLSVAPVTLERESRADLSGFLEERIGGLDDIRANGSGAHVIARHAAITDGLIRRGTGAALAGRTIWVLSDGIFVVGSLLALCAGIYLLHLGEISLGTVYLLVQYAAMARMPLNRIGNQLQDVQRAAASLGRIRGLLNVTPGIRDGNETVPAPERAPRLTFDHVNFTYRNGTRALRDITFSLEAGQVLGVLGRTGSGKTTMIRLLSRLYDADSGTIALDGRNIRDMRLAHLRRCIGIVTQDVQIFTGSVRDNVRLFDPGIDDASITGTLERVGLGDWLARCPRGLDTELAGSAGLSAGEAQLLAFARVFFREPGLIVLDEASSRLDPVTDRRIELATDSLLQPRSPGSRPPTAIIIAHKLKTLDRANQVVILDGGRIVEAGVRAKLAADPESRLSRLLATARDGVIHE